jgi:UDP-2,3-diacylglucosamine hydrolase
LSAHYFVSDAHIGGGFADAEQRLFTFFESIRGKAESLYILGDLFEFWFEYNHAIPKQGFRALAELAELSRTGTRIGYLKGNHDFWFKDFWRRELGAEAADELDVTLDGRRVYLAHGDALDRALVPRVFRVLMRSRVNGWLYSLLHPDIGIGLAQAVARASRVTSAKPSLVADMAGFAEGKLAAGFDIVIMGHSHVPELRRSSRGVYINLGNWVTDFTYGVIRDGVPSLEVFEDPCREQGVGSREQPE